MKIETIHFKTIVSKRRLQKTKEAQTLPLFDASVQTPSPVSILHPPSAVEPLSTIAQDMTQSNGKLMERAELVLMQMNDLSCCILGYDDMTNVLSGLLDQLACMPKMNTSEKLAGILQMVELRGKVELAKRGIFLS